jgi:hypothetical protein
MTHSSNRAVIESVEPRRLLSVSAALNGATLEVASDAAGDYVNVSTLRQADGTATVRSGTTSVYLDPAALALAGLTISGVNSTGTPASADYQVGFPITPSTSFRYNVDPFAPLSGQIAHSGTVSFNSNTITVGNFAIGFDPARATGNRSGFFVQDTFGGLGILFDVGTPTAATISASTFSVAADLLVSPEFAGALNNTALAGADAGNALVDGRSVANQAPFVVVTGQGFTRRFAASAVNSVQIDMNGGNDTVSLLNLSKPTSVSLDDGNDRLYNVNGGGAFAASAGNGDDYVNLLGGRFSSVSVDAGAGNDAVVATGVRISGIASFNGGSGHDRLWSFGSDIDRSDATNFEFRLIV